jgi:SAM-dependent methyltransferase
MSNFWYHERHKKTHPSALKILSFIKSLYNYDSVVDLGCGVGTWLFTAKELGAKSVKGFDASQIDTSHLMISPEEFQRFDLNVPFNANTKYDLGISLEVAEHINAKSADAYIKLLTSLSSFILFSAAIPGQGGTGHINEQEPKYWIEKFAAQGFVLIDVLRPGIWDDSETLPWYKQNCLCFAHKDLYESLHEKVKNIENWKGRYLIHPYFFDMKREQLSSPVKLTKAFAKLLLRRQ